MRLWTDRDPASSSHRGLLPIPLSGWCRAEEHALRLCMCVLGGVVEGSSLLLTAAAAHPEPSTQVAAQAMMVEAAAAALPGERTSSDRRTWLWSQATPKPPNPRSSSPGFAAAASLRS